MNRQWVDSYPPGVPAEIDKDAFPSINALLADAQARFGPLPAFSNMGATLTYDELARQVSNFASYLQYGIGMAKGDRIAIMMPNLLQYPIALFGAMAAGCLVVNVNPQYTARELQQQLSNSGATCIVVLENFAHTVQEVLANTPLRRIIVARLGDMLHFPRAQLTDFVVKHVKHLVPPWQIDGAIDFDDVLGAGAQLARCQVRAEPADIALLQYTGGTTGVPKAAILTHANIVANVLQTSAWVAGTLRDGHETAVVPLPLYHVFALTSMLCFVHIGAHIVLVTDPRDIDGFIKVLAHARMTVLIGVNTLFKALLEAPNTGRIDGSALKAVIAGGMALQHGVAEQWQQRFGATLIEGYGLTEASPFVCANPLGQRAFNGMIGLPLPSTEVSILNELGEPVALGELGEICVRGPQLMQAYWKMPQESANVFTLSGALRTGDLGTMDEHGYVKLLDRKKDVIIVSGLKVFPNEVEDVIATHPGVHEVVAIGADDEHSGEVVMAVVIKSELSLTADAIIDHCRRNLAPYKVPRYVVFRDKPLPKSNIGKVLRRLVKEEQGMLLRPSPGLNPLMPGATPLH